MGKPSGPKTVKTVAAPLTLRMKLVLVVTGEIVEVVVPVSSVLGEAELAVSELCDVVI